MAELALRETSKYSIAFAKAEHKCGTVVQFYDNDTILCIGSCSNRFLEGVEIISGGTGYNDDNPPRVSVTGGVTGAEVILKVENGRIVDAFVTRPGRGSSEDPNQQQLTTITIEGTNRTGVLRAIEGGCIMKERDTVKLEYTDQDYEDTSGFPKTTPFPNIGGSPPFDDDYLMGNDYIKLVGDGEGGEGQLGAGKTLEDLPRCLATPTRIDVIPSIERMGYYKLDSNEGNRREEDTRYFEAYVFGGDNPTQSILWESQSGSFVESGHIKDNINLAKIGTFKPAKSVTAGSIIITARMVSDPTLLGEAVIFLIPQIVVNWPNGDRGYTSGRDMKIEAWVFGGVNRQKLEFEVLGSTIENDEDDEDDDKTDYVVATNTLFVGKKETAEYLTLRITDGNSPIFKNPPLGVVDINIYRKYITITSDVDGNNIVYDLTPEFCEETVSCEEITKQLYARLRVDDPEYEENRTNQNITNLAIWSISGNTLSETTIANGLLKFGVRDTIFQDGNILPNGHVWYTPNDGKITSIIITNRGTGYGSDATAHITISEEKSISLTITVVDGEITNVELPADDDNVGFNPATIITIDCDTGGGFAYRLVIDKHFENDNTPTVFMRQCERGTISVNVNFDGVRANTLPDPNPDS